MKRRVTAWTAAGTFLAAALYAALPVASYKEARRVLEAGIQAMGGLEALREIKDVVREGRGTAYAQGQGLKPDGALLARAIEIKAFQDFAGNRSAAFTATTGAGILPGKVRAVATDTGFTYNMVAKLTTPMTPGEAEIGRAHV